jgi:integrase
MAVNKDGKKLPQGITQRKDGRYQASYMWGGKRYFIYNKDLKALKKEKEAKIYELEHGIASAPDKIIVDAWFNTWITEYKEKTVKLTTLTNYKDHYRLHIKPVFGRLKMQEVRPEHIQRFYNNMDKQGYSKKTIEMNASILCNMFKQAERNKLISKNPVPLAIIPKAKSKGESRVLSEQEQKIFMELAKETYLHTLFVIALSTGMRIGELLGLEWSDIDYKRNVIHVTRTLKRLNNGDFYKSTPKTKCSKRDIPLLPSTAAMLKSQKTEQAKQKIKLGDKWSPLKGFENLVFTAPTGRPQLYINVQYQIDKMVELMNKQEVEKAEKEKREPVIYDHIHPHALRHTFATRGLENGIPPKVMQEILGHSSIKMTLDLYSHVLPQTKQTEIMKIANLF